MAAEKTNSPEVEKALAAIDERLVRLGEDVGRILDEPRGVRTSERAEPALARWMEQSVGKLGAVRLAREAKRLANTSYTHDGTNYMRPAVLAYLRFLTDLKSQLVNEPSILDPIAPPRPSPSMPITPAVEQEAIAPAIIEPDAPKPPSGVPRISAHSPRRFPLVLGILAFALSQTVDKVLDVVGYGPWVWKTLGDVAPWLAHPVQRWEALLLVISGALIVRAFSR